MQEPIIKFKNNWDFTVYQYKDKETISVVFHNSFVDISKVFLLTDTEKKFNFDELKALAENIRNNYEAYKNREIIITSN